MHLHTAQLELEPGYHTMASASTDVKMLDALPSPRSALSTQSFAQGGNSAGSRKRKKLDNGEAANESRERRLRRSHEACARCRSKKIKVRPALFRRLRRPGRAFPSPSPFFAHTPFSATPSIPDAGRVR